MRQRPWTRLTVLSAMVCAIVLLVAVRSLFRSDHARFPLSPNRSLAVLCIDGKLWVISTSTSYAAPSQTTFVSRTADDARSLWGRALPGMSGLHWLGIGWRRMNVAGVGSGVSWTMNTTYISLSLWLVALLTAIPPGVWRWKRRQAGQGFEVQWRFGRGRSK